MKDRSSATHKKYQPDRQDILWNTDWGVSRTNITEEGAKERGLGLFKGRWISLEERSILKRQRSAYRWIRIIALLFIMGGTLPALLQLPFVFVSGTWPMVYQLWPTVVGIGCVAVGFGLYHFGRWARYASMVIGFLAVISLLFLVIDQGAGYFSAGVLVILLAFFYFMLRNATRTVFEKQLSPVRETEFRWYKTAFGRLLIAGPAITVVVLILLVFLGESTKKQCDAAAADDVRRLQRAMERFAAEIRDLNCDSATVMKEFSNDHLKYIAGPYYGWRGTNGKCKVLIRIQGNELVGCAVRGSRPNGDRDKRLIYREAILGTTVSDPEEGACTGKQYGYFPDHLYFNSMLESKEGKCALKEPEELAGNKPYLWKEYYQELENYRKK